MNLYWGDGFRFQDPYYSACTATSAMDTLNFISYRKTGGTGFVWGASRSGTRLQSMLSWARAHDTLEGGSGSDPHGWRNTLNYYGWGSGALLEGKRVYEDASYKTYAGAVKAAVRAVIKTRKPVGVLAWAGRHAQMITGYYGLVGDPFAKNLDGTYKNTFTIEGVYLSDPLQSDGFVNARDLVLPFPVHDELPTPVPAVHPDGQPAGRPVHERQGPLQGRVVRQVRPRHPAQISPSRGGFAMIGTCQPIPPSRPALHF